MRGHSPNKCRGTGYHEVKRSDILGSVRKEICKHHIFVSSSLTVTAPHSLSIELGPYWRTFLPTQARACGNRSPPSSGPSLPDATPGRTAMYRGSNDTHFVQAGARRNKAISSMYLDDRDVLGMLLTVVEEKEVTRFSTHSHTKMDSDAKLRNKDCRKCATLCVFSVQRIHRSQMVGLQSA